ncbi:MAG TPA: ABC transporter substrate-binding protein, partial [Acidobacteriota bacterium]|nr:ABC transporter substrate-binding protein [Acidobacteriota bacterium]
MKKPVWCFAVAVLFFLSAHPFFVESAEKIARVGILFVGGKDQPHLESFKQGLREHGYVEGKNIILEYRYAEGKPERFGELTADLVRAKVDVIVTTSSISAIAARKVTRTVPIVITSGNPLELGLAESLAHPGGNVTGLSSLLSDLSGKRVELLKESFPKISRAAVLWTARTSESAIG